MKETITILTNDPSLTGWGWAVITDGRIRDTGCLKTAPENKKKRIRKSDDTTRRISEINMSLINIIQTYRVGYILSEAPHGSQNASAATMIGIALGIVQTISDCLEIPVEYYSEQDSKKCVLKKKAATKTEMIDKIKELYPNMKWKGVKYVDEAVADAMAVYHTAKQFSTTLKMIL